MKVHPPHPRPDGSHVVMRFLRLSLLAAIILGLGACSSHSAVKKSASSTHKPAKKAGQTSCTSLLYIGDSVSIGMISSLQTPRADQRLEAQIAAVGVKQLHVNVSGGRSTFERLEHRINTLDVLRQAKAAHYTGCYFFALGLNDAADASAGGPSDRSRIDAIMQQAGSSDVLWPLGATNLVAGPYANIQAEKFNNELQLAAKRYPHLRLYNWAGERQKLWTEGDGIHDRGYGSRERARAYAHALAVAFPQGSGPSSQVVVGSVAGRNPVPSNLPQMAAQPGDHAAPWSTDARALILYTSGPKL